MEKPIYPLKNMRITQGYGEGTHVDSYAIDDAGENTESEEIYAPFSGTIKKIYTQDANEVWLESDNPVEYPDGTIDYMTILLAHTNDISKLYVGKKIKQKEAFYKEGTSGNATGNHCHIECAKGKYQSPGWFANAKGYYVIINGKKPEECLWIDENTNVINNNGYSFQKITKESINTKPEEDSDIEQLEPLPETSEENEQSNDIENQDPIPKLIYTCTKDDLYGIYLKKGENLYLK